MSGGRELTKENFCPLYGQSHVIAHTGDHVGHFGSLGSLKVIAALNRSMTHDPMTHDLLALLEEGLRSLAGIFPHVEVEQVEIPDVVVGVRQQETAGKTRLAHP